MATGTTSTATAKASGSPRWLNPSHLMHALPAAAPFSEAGWIFEVKQDGLRLLAQKHGQEVRVQSRRGLDMHSYFPEIVEGLHALADDFAIDAELVLLDASGAPDFDRLRHRALFRSPERVRAASEAAPATLYAFDLLQHDGEDIRFLPLIDRKKMLQGILVDSARIRCLEHVEEQGEALYAEAEQHRLEGIVAKRLDSPYISGRSGYWLKIKTELGRRREADRRRNLRDG